MANYMVRIDADRCKGCELCKTFCPKDLIVMGSHVNDKGYFPAFAERLEECIGCCSCALMCPDGAIEIFEEEA